MTVHAIHPRTLLALALSCLACASAEDPAAGDLAVAAEPVELAAEATPAGQDGDSSAAQKALEATTAVIQSEVEELRGARFEAPVKVAVADAEELRRYMQARMEATTTPEELAADEEIAKLCGLLPADFDLVDELLALIESQVGGFYDPTTKAFYLMEAFQGDLARVILAHELTHALDDQLFDLDAGFETRRGNSDALWAYQAVAEGSGTAVMQKWTMRHLKELDPAAMQEMSSMGMDELRDAPPYLWKPLVGVYLRGQSFLSAAPDEIELPDAIRRAFESPPRSSEQVLHPDKYWDADDRDDPLPVAVDRSRIPAGWTALDEDTLGELHFGLMVEPPAKRGGVKSMLSLIGARLSFPASEGWGGDRSLLIGAGEGDRLLVVATAWDTEEDAAELEAALEAQREHLLGGLADALHVRRDGARVVLALARGAGVDLCAAALEWADFSALPAPSAEAAGQQGG